ncbi:MAG: hypothetical protein Q4G64_06860 [bacterium]|nr:hypothetical protein [bacterium]
MRDLPSRLAGPKIAVVPSVSEGALAIHQVRVVSVHVSEPPDPLVAEPSVELHDQVPHLEVRAPSCRPHLMLRFWESVRLRHIGSIEPLKLGVQSTQVVEGDRANELAILQPGSGIESGEKELAVELVMVESGVNPIDDPRGLDRAEVENCVGDRSAWEFALWEWQMYAAGELPRWNAGRLAAMWEVDLDDLGTIACHAPEKCG